MSKKLDDKNILGLYASFKMGDPAKEAFLPYLWGPGGLGARLGGLRRSDYGKDLQLILLQFYVRPIPDVREHLREIERFRPKEKAIGVPVIVDDSNFFDKSEEDRQEFIATTILEKLELVRKVVVRNKLDCDIGRLRSDVEEILRKRGHAA